MAMLRRWGLLGCFAATLALATPAGARDDAATYRLAERLVSAVNAVRARAGLSRIALSPHLGLVAQALAEDLAARRTLSHEDGKGAGLAARLARAGYRYAVAVENLAAGFATPEETVAQWMTSPGHRANMLEPHVTEAGVGFVERLADRPGKGYRYYWALDMAKARVDGASGRGATLDQPQARVLRP